MANTLPPQATTGANFKLGVRPYNTTGDYTNVSYLTNLKPPKASTDGADTTTLIADVMGDTPTIPKIEAGGTVNIVEADPGFILMEQSVYANPPQWLSFQITAPSGATKTFDGWINSWEPSDITKKDIRSQDFTISVQTKPLYTAPPTS